MLGHIDIQIEHKLQRDERRPERTRRGHLIEPGHLAELPLERRGHRRCHHGGTRPRIKRENLDRRIVNLRQRGNGKLPVRHGPSEQNRSHEQRSRDRAQNKWPGRIHQPCFPCFLFFGAPEGSESLPGAGALPPEPPAGPLGEALCTSTGVPACNRSCPSTTT